MSTFITQQDLSDLLGRDVTADAGALMAVEAACDVVRVTAEQNFDAVYSDMVTLDGTGTDCLLLPEMPVLAAGTVLVAGSAITDYVLADNGRLIRKTQGSALADWWWWSDWWWGWPYLPVGPSGGIGAWNEMPPAPVWPMGRQNVQVTYDHGYAGTAIPPSVRAVALSLAARIVVQGVAVAEAVGASNVRYAGPAMDLTKGEAAILRRFRPTR